MTDARGYTLIDTLVVAALCSTLGAVSVPVIGGALDRERTIIGARVLASQLQRARFEALKRARTVGVRLEVVGDRTRMQLFLDGDGDGLRQVDVDAGIDPPLAPLEFLDQHSRGVSLRINQGITDAGGGSDIPAGADPLRIGNTALLAFSPLGSATSGTLYVAGHRGPQMAIRVFGATGRVRLLTFDAQARQWRH
ncbi:MAG TPA: GspH/FimT family pseudopilin [Vicinamibacterales bacterium]